MLHPANWTSPAGESPGRADAGEPGSGPRPVAERRRGERGVKSGERGSREFGAHSEEIYRSPEFRDAWAVARHLENGGAIILLNVSGPVPRSMCGPDGVTLVDGDSYVEMLVSLVRRAVRGEGLAVPYFGPLNETDIGPPEGPFADAPVASAVLEQLRDRPSEDALAHIKIVGFDRARVIPDYLKFLSGRSGTATLLDVAGLHCYRDDVDYAPVLELRPKIGEPALWLTEYGDLDNTGEHELDVAISSARRLVRAMNMGVTAALAWDAYDSCEVCYRTSSPGSGQALTVPGRSIFTVTTLGA